MNVPKAKTYLKTLPWSLITLLALLQLLRPILSILGIAEEYHGMRQIILSILLTIAWVAIVVWKQPRQPVGTLVAAGILYAILSTLLAVTVQLAGDWDGKESASIPLILSVGLIASSVSNGIWGLLLGLVSRELIRVRSTKK